MTTLTLTEQNFEETVLAEGITIVDFWAEWCGRCKMFGPIFEKSSDAHPTIRFGKVDTEAEQGLAAALQIRSIPTIMVFRDGVLLFNQAGALPEHSLEQIITSAEGLDMDAIRAEIAEAEKSEQGS
jgi:thioredoxin 1